MPDQMKPSPQRALMHVGRHASDVFWFPSSHSSPLFGSSFPLPQNGPGVPVLDEVVVSPDESPHPANAASVIASALVEATKIA
jgi:hypothetical protein